MKNLERDRLAYQIVKSQSREGLNHREIAKYLNDTGVKPPMKVPWSSQSVSSLKRKMDRWDARKRKIIIKHLKMQVPYQWDGMLDMVINTVPIKALISSASFSPDKGLTVVYSHEKTEFTLRIKLEVLLRSL
jgi:hypothetical protein